MSNWNLNYPDYNEMGVGTPPTAARDAAAMSLLNSAGSAAAGGASGLIPGVAAATGLLGTAASAYGSYEQASQAKKQYELQVEAWHEQQRIEEEERRRAHEQQLADNILKGGTYAHDLAKEGGQAYGSYARARGL